jgi:Flp pilus assembly protein TadG
VELCLVLPFLMTILLAVIEFGFYGFTLYNVSSGARVGARAGAVGRTNAEIYGVVALAMTWQGGGSTTSQVYVHDEATVLAHSGRVPPLNDAAATLSTTARSTHNSRTNGGNFFYLTVKVSRPYQSFTSIVDLNAIAGIATITSSASFPIYF